MPKVEFFDINSSQFHEKTTLSGDEKIQVSADEFVRLQSIANLFKLNSDTIPGNIVTTNTEQTITGRKVFTDICLKGQYEDEAMPYFVGIDSFTDGGAMKYITASKVANAIGVYTKTEADGRFLTSHQPLDHINITDVRDDDTQPNTYARSLRYLLKRNPNIGLDDGGNYTSVLHLAPWIVNDTSGGMAKQLALSDNGNLYIRQGSMDATSWSPWHRFAFIDSNVASASKINGKSIVTLSQSEYAALSTKDVNTIYLVTD